MDSTALVSLDIEDGERVVKALDDAGKTPAVALWAKLPDYENWRLIVASEHLDQSSQFSAYMDINAAMDKAAIPIHRQPSILMRPMADPMIRDLRRVFGPTHDTFGMRLGGQRFGDKYLEDGFVYRIR